MGRSPVFTFRGSAKGRIENYAEVEHLGLLLVLGRWEEVA